MIKDKNGVIILKNDKVTVYYDGIVNIDTIDVNKGTYSLKENKNCLSLFDGINSLITVLNRNNFGKYL